VYAGRKKVAGKTGCKYEISFKGGLKRFDIGVLTRESETCAGEGVSQGLTRKVAVNPGKCTTVLRNIQRCGKLQKNPEKRVHQDGIAGESFQRTKNLKNGTNKKRRKNIA